MNVSQRPADLIAEDQMIFCKLVVYQRKSAIYLAKNLSDYRRTCKK